jgi:hypothetical protein
MILKAQYKHGRETGISEANLIILGLVGETYTIYRDHYMYSTYYFAGEREMG